MGIKPNFTRDDIKARCDAFIEAVKKKEIDRMMMLGEKCVIHAREVPPEIGFHDQTGNLRSSIGYAVFVDGVAVHSAYEQTLNGSTGVRAGQELAEKVGCTTTGVCLVVTAGMNYAVYVESKGRDVIASAEQLAIRELPIMLAQLTSNISRAADSSVSTMGTMGVDTIGTMGVDSPTVSADNASPNETPVVNTSQPQMDDEKK